MAQFSVKTKQARLQVDNEQQMIGELGKYEDSINQVANHLSFKAASLENIQMRLRNVANQVDAQRAGMSGMCSALTEIVQEYDRTEQRVYTNAGGKGNLQMKDIASRIADIFQEDEKVFTDFVRRIAEAIQNGEMPEEIWNRIEELQLYVNEMAHNAGGMAGLLIAIPELVKNGLDAFNGTVDKIKDNLIEKTGFNVEAKTQGSVYSKEIDSEHGSLGVSALAYEAYAAADGGVFRKDEDGNLVFNPNVSARAGVSVTALEAIGAYRIGNQWLGADANGRVTVGKVSGEAEVQASLMDADGNFDPHAKLNASAEAILVDAEASAGVTVLGTRADVTGSVNIGVGAHANVEVGGGKISCDIGASLGIGASVSFTIDYSGTINAVKKAAKSAFKGAWKALRPW